MRQSSWTIYYLRTHKKNLSRGTEAREVVIAIAALPLWCVAERVMNEPRMILIGGKTSSDETRALIGESGYDLPE